ncbi:hypothetical protein [Acinetobacter chinensis]|uniref:hypothetical protein n=1 Tax=Acinetobacter chinensis TaxID=2004650 RepID=UPI002934376E|nr:hypothetical protein [Acinetobacter chinensis]WOE40092.1 hypothetical protein QSG87_09215 [Acinetobacter chinensis]
MNMNRLRELSKISNAVLTPEQNAAILKIRINHSGRAQIHESISYVSAKETEFRKKWCAAQTARIGEFGAVMGVTK